MTQLAVARAILPGKEEAWRRFLQELLGTRRSAFVASRTRWGISSELVWCFEIAGLAVAVTCVEALEPGPTLLQAPPREDGFERWYGERLLEFHGVSPTQRRAPRFQPPLFEWRRP